jgi:hypothetical protein
LRPFSTLPWNHTNVKLRRIWPHIHSFPAFNPAGPPRLCSPSSENKSLLSVNVNPKIVTKASQNGSRRQ